MHRTSFFLGFLIAAGFGPAAGTMAAENSRVEVLSPVSGREMLAAKCDASGTIHLIYNGKRGPHYVRSTDGGATFSRPLEVVHGVKRQPGLEYLAWDMAVGPRGDVHVALGNNGWKIKTPIAERGYYYARLDSGASEFTPARTINGRPSEGFSVAVKGDGTVTACWMANKLYANISHDNGATFEPTIEVDPKFDPCNCCTTTCTYGTDGRLAILYREETNNDRDMYLALWDQARETTEKTRISTAPWKIDACPMSYYTLTPLADGYIAVWPTKGTIYFARLDKDGKVLSPGEIKTAGTNGMRTGMFTLVNSAGTTLIGWKKDGRLGWQLFDKQGETIGQPQSAASAGSGAAGALAQDGRFLLFP